jgi:hypothetical protein
MMENCSGNVVLHGIFGFLHFVAVVGSPGFNYEVQHRRMKVRLVAFLF